MLFPLIPIVVLLFCTLLAAAPATTQASRDLRVMSFNLRFSKANDGANSWPNRRDMLVRAIQEFDPDLLGTQECLADQADFLREKLTGYTFVGVGRNDGKRAGEFSAIFIRSERFDLVDSGTFWLSPTPDKTASKGWDADLTRIVTWAKLRDRQSGKSLAWLNTHWDHKGQQARLQSAGIMRRWIEEHAADSPALITGDFNAHTDAPPYARMFDSKEWKRHLTDAFAALHPGDVIGGGSFHGFTGKGAGARIDWIICSDELEPIEAEIDHYNEEGRYPSDHFPATARLRWR